MIDRVRMMQMMMMKDVVKRPYGGNVIVSPDRRYLMKDVAQGSPGRRIICRVSVGSVRRRRSPRVKSSFRHVLRRQTLEMETEKF